MRVTVEGNTQRAVEDEGVRVARWVLGMVVVALLAAGGVFLRVRGGDGDIIVGRPEPSTQQALAGATVVLPASPTTEPRTSQAARSAGAAVRVPVMRWPDASPYGEAVAFESDVPVPDDLLFVLVVGSDARSGERWTGRERTPSTCSR